MKYLHRLTETHENFAERYWAVRTMKVILVDMRLSETFNDAVLATPGSYLHAVVPSCTLTYDNHITVFFFMPIDKMHYEGEFWLTAFEIMSKSDKSNRVSAHPRPMQARNQQKQTRSAPTSLIERVRFWIACYFTRPLWLWRWSIHPFLWLLLCKR